MRLSGYFAWQVTRLAKPSAIEKTVRIGQLLDLYGKLLTERQRRFVTLHFFEDMSFGEIAREFGISRQAVHDAVRNGEEALNNYEEKLGLAERFSEAESAEQPAAESETQPTGGGLGDLIARLESLHQEIAKSGGVIYNGNQIGRELAALIEQAKRLTSD